MWPHSHQAPDTAPNVSRLPLQSEFSSGKEEFLVEVPSERSQDEEQVESMFETENTEKNSAEHIAPTNENTTTTHTASHDMSHDMSHDPASNTHPDIIRGRSQVSMSSPDTGTALEDRHASVQSRKRNENISSLSETVASSTDKNICTQETRLEEQFSIGREAMESSSQEESMSDKENSGSEELEGEYLQGLFSEESLYNYHLLLSLIPSHTPFLPFSHPIVCVCVQEKCTEHQLLTRRCQRFELILIECHCNVNGFVNTVDLSNPNP